MADLFFPQLSSGALAQYPIRKNISTRTIRNVLPDGSLILYPDPSASHIVWELSCQGLDTAEANALAGLFSSCQGRFQSFYFIDPTDNMLVQSADLTAAAWIASPGMNVTGNAGDPFGGVSAFTLTNASQVTAQLAQAVYAPANYQYCFSVYVTGTAPTAIGLELSGPISQQANQYQAANSWKRIALTGALPDAGNGITVAISLPPGGQIIIYGPQLEAQVSPSAYHPTLAQSALYPDAHWATDSLPVSAEALDVYSAAFTIEAMISTT